jgi:gluconolactonase
MSWYPVPPTITAEVFCEVPTNYRRPGQRSVWADINRSGATIDCFVEGPSFDRAGNLYFVDIPWGRIFRADPAGKVDLVAEYDGEPNGLRIHKDGSIYIADYKHGIMKLDPATGTVTEHCTRFRLESFKGCNDLAFASDGTMAWTDQGQTGHQDPTGRVFRLAPDGKLDCMMSGIPSPNGLVWSLDDKILYVAVTRANAVWRLPIMLDNQVSKVGTFIQMSGGMGPDGISITADGGLVVSHVGLGAIWVFDKLGQPLYRVNSPTGHSTTNIAFGGPDNKDLYITESDTGTILRARLPVAGATLYSHQ